VSISSQEDYTLMDILRALVNAEYLVEHPEARYAPFVDFHTNRIFRARFGIREAVNIPLYLRLVATAQREYGVKNLDSETLEQVIEKILQYSGRTLPEAWEMKIEEFETLWSVKLQEHVEVKSSPRALSLIPEAKGNEKSSFTDVEIRDRDALTNLPQSETPEQLIAKLAGLPKHAKKAYLEFRLAYAALGHVLDKTYYDWLINRGEEKLPVFETWTKSLRVARGRLGEQKKQTKPNLGVGKKLRNGIPIHKTDSSPDE
jgi:hypothetical protein